MYKSEKLVHQIKQLIENGSYSPHTKLPSIRIQAEISGYSLMTVLNAYQLLVAEGRVYSKEKSGFFVAESYTSKTINDNYAYGPQTVKINSKVFSYLKATQRLDQLYFSSAFPDEKCLYNAKIMRTLATHAQQKPLPLDGINNNMPPGNAKLRQQIANRYNIQDVPTHANDIIITSGALDALNLSLQTLTMPGDYILLQDTIFYGAWQAAERLGLHVITLPIDMQYGFDLEAFENILSKYPIKVCWFMLNSHNPIGFTVT